MLNNFFEPEIKKRMSLIEVQKQEIQAFEDVLPNGMKVVTISMPHVHTLELCMLIRAGLRFENKNNNGVSHFLEHMMFRGNRAYPDSISLNLEFERIGRELRAATHSDYTYYGFNPHISQVERGLELFSDFFIEPTFAGLEIERGIILEEYLEDVNEKGDNTDINTLACGLLYKNTPLAWPTTGTPETINKITEESLRKYFEEFYVPENMILAAAGPVYYPEFLEAVKKQFSGFSPGGSVVTKDHFKSSVDAEQKKAAWVFQHDTDSQIQLQVCFRSVSYNDPEYLSANLISRIFDDGATSRLPRILRETRGLVYSVECRATGWPDIGTMDFDVSVSPDKACEVLEILLDEIRTLVDKGPEEGELERIQQRYFYELDESQDEPAQQIMRHAFPLLYSKVMTLEQERETVRGITHEKIMDMARQIFTRDRLNVIVVGPYTQDLKKQIEKIAEVF